ncbi:MAG: tetratricopeptide repeat protein [Thermoguttaceae bacterium]
MARQLHLRNHRPRRLLSAVAVVLAGLASSLSGCGEFAAASRNADGVKLYDQARYQEALAQFQEAAYNDPRSADADYNRAAVCHRMGKQQHCQSDLQQAECYYHLCLDKDPSHTDCYRGLAVLLAEQGRSQEAFQLLEGWVQRQPCMADARIELARLNEEFGNRQAAETQLLAAIEVEPDSARAWAAKGRLRELAGDNAQAVANYQRSLYQDQHQPELVARVNTLQGRPATASPTSPTSPMPSAPAIDMGTRMADRTQAPAK